MATVHRYPFELVGADGGPLRGEIRSAAPAGGGPAIIVCHGFKGFKDWGFFPILAQRLARSGITTVSFNLSGSGVVGEDFSEPERFARATHSGDVRDVHTVCGALKDGGVVESLAPIQRFGVFGHSRGGGTAILFAADEPAVTALVTWAAIDTVHRWSEEVAAQWRQNGQIEIVNSRTGQVLALYTDLLDDIDRHGNDELNIPAAAARIRARWLIIHGDEDESVPVSSAFKLHAGARRETTELLVVAGASHGFGGKHPWAGSTPQLDQVMDRTVQWFTKHLL